jgi:hypothetical protein
MLKRDNSDHRSRRACQGGHKSAAREHPGDRLRETIMNRGFVYVFSISGVYGPSEHALYKIGKSRDPNSRAMTLGALPGPVKEVHQIWTTDMDWLERKLHRKYRAKKHYGEWFLLDPADLRGLTELRVCDRILDPTFFGLPVEPAHLPPRGIGKPRLSPAACEERLHRRGWNVRACPPRRPPERTWVIVAERGQNRIVRGGKTEEAAWWYAFWVECRAFRETKPTHKDLLIQERGAG